MKRTSVVEQLKSRSVTNSSTIQIGDTEKANPMSRIIALQKEGTTFQGDLPFEDYSIFNRQANLPQSTSHVKKATFHHAPTIHVQHVAVSATSTSSILHVGNLNHIEADARVKHFRILLQAYH